MGAHVTTRIIRDQFVSITICWSDDTVPRFHENETRTTAFERTGPLKSSGLGFVSMESWYSQVWKLTTLMCLVQLVTLFPPTLRKSKREVVVIVIIRRSAPCLLVWRWRWRSLHVEHALLCRVIVATTILKKCKRVNLVQTCIHRTGVWNCAKTPHSSEGVLPCEREHVITRPTYLNVRCWSGVWVGTCVF